MDDRAAASDDDSIAPAKDGISYKPQIVGNPQCDKPLEERRKSRRRTRPPTLITPASACSRGPSSMKLSARSKTGSSMRPLLEARVQDDRRHRTRRADARRDQFIVAGRSVDRATCKGILKPSPAGCSKQTRISLTTAFTIRTAAKRATPPIWRTFLDGASPTRTGELLGAI